MRSIRVLVFSEAIEPHNLRFWLGFVTWFGIFMHWCLCDGQGFYIRILRLGALGLLKAQAKLDRRVHKRAQGHEGNVKWFWGVAKIQGDGEAFIGDFQIVEPMLHHDGHFIGIAI